jgi:hypothetical protein
MMGGKHRQRGIPYALPVLSPFGRPLDDFAQNGLQSYFALDDVDFLTFAGEPAATTHH